MENIYEWYKSLDGGQLLGLVFTTQIAIIMLINMIIYGLPPLIKEIKIMVQKILKRSGGIMKP